MLTHPDPAPTTAAGTGAGTRVWQDLVTAGLGVWFTVGLMLDAWAHNNIPELETFFTPWHAAFYSGFAATAAWILWLSRRAWTRPAAPWIRLPDPALVPRGYLAALWALPAFALAGAGDLAWHLAFGIEQNIDILFSPTHLGLVSAMVVIVTAPARSAWTAPAWPDPSAPAAGWRRLGPAIGATALAATLVLLFLQYANALVLDSAQIVSGLSGADGGFTSRLVSSLVVTNLVLLLPLLVLARRWRLPFGTVTTLYALAGALSLAVSGFSDADTVIGLLAGGVLADLAGLALRPDPARPVRWIVWAAAVPLLTWSAVLAVAALTVPPMMTSAGLGAQVAAIELVTGAPLVQALAGVLVALLLRARDVVVAGASG